MGREKISRVVFGFNFVIICCSSNGRWRVSLLSVNMCLTIASISNGGIVKVAGSSCMRICVCTDLGIVVQAAVL